MSYIRYLIILKLRSVAQKRAQHSGVCFQYYTS
ncbi:BnaC08g49710D [Brassica napus]|uniref:BnaC08g49710D protein n=1 Tax=Brassica napus TaxID=3708 RepID=A0A078IY92_BRANA|nr:BnaC08g49710D [Brassica napus]